MHSQVTADSKGKPSNHPPIGTSPSRGWVIGNHEAFRTNLPLTQHRKGKVFKKVLLPWVDWYSSSVLWGWYISCWGHFRTVLYICPTFHSTGPIVLLVFEGLFLVRLLCRHPSSYSSWNIWKYDSCMKAVV